MEYFIQITDDELSFGKINLKLSKEDFYANNVEDTFIMQLH